MMRRLPFRQVAHLSQASSRIPVSDDRSNAWTSYKVKDGDVVSGDSEPLRGLGIGIKANLCTTDFPTDCSSQMLKGTPYMS